MNVRRETSKIQISRSNVHRNPLASGEISDHDVRLPDGRSGAAARPPSDPRASAAGGSGRSSTEDRPRGPEGVNAAPVARSSRLAGVAGHFHRLARDLEAASRSKDTAQGARPGIDKVSGRGVERIRAP